jgi:hypothetical protein
VQHFVPHRVRGTLWIGFGYYFTPQVDKLVYARAVHGINAGE